MSEAGIIEISSSVPKEINISRISQGVPIGGELDYLDDGTLITAIKSRREL